MVSMEEIDIDKQEKMSMFFLPRAESAKAARKEEPIRHPMKKEDCGKPVMKVLAHSRPQWDMMVMEECESQDQEDLGILQMSEDEVHVVWLVQCHVGYSSV